MRYLLFITTITFLFSCGSDSNMENSARESKSEEIVKEIKDHKSSELHNSKEILSENSIEPGAMAEQSQLEIKKSTGSEIADLSKSIKENTTTTKETANNTKVKKEKPKKKKKRAKISFEEKVFDFGDIRDGDIVKHDFKFKNIGNAPLNIKNVTASCGCTQPSFPFMPIEPGEEGVINVTFNSTGKINEQRPTVTVTTNGRPSTIKLNLTGMVRQKL